MEGPIITALNCGKFSFFLKFGHKAYNNVILIWALGFFF